MLLALATCASLPDFEADDRPLHDALAARGATVEHPVWNDPAVDWARYDACLIRTTWDYHEHRDAFVAWARAVAAVTTLHNPRPIVEWNTHKRYLRELGDQGVPTAPTVWLDRGDPVDLGAVLSTRGWSRAFLKPAVGATARETLRFDIDDLAGARAHLDRLLPHEDMLLQPYLRRVETDGERSAIFIDGVLTHAVRKIPRPGDYRVQDDFGATDEPAQLREDEHAIALDVMHRVGADLLYARVDMLRSDDGDPYVTEVELVEPSLFFRHEPSAAIRLADALCRIATRA